MSTFDDIRKRAINEATGKDDTILPHNGKPGAKQESARPQRKAGYYLLPSRLLTHEH